MRRAERREQFLTAGLTLPALAIILVFVAVPLGWLVVLSLLDGGQPSLANYTRLFADASFGRSLWLTLWIALVVTAIAGFLGYVLAFAISVLPRWSALLCLALTTLPFWSSVLVRTYAWMVLLGRRGLVNTALQHMGLISAPLPLINNATGTVIAMVHIMLPFVVFPLYASLQSMDQDAVRAALAHGATPGQTFRMVVLPLSLPGLAAGLLLTFVMCLGFYVTPALLGGGHTIVMALLIERDVNIAFSWGPASATSVLFVLAVLVLFGVAGRFISPDRLLRG